jgi:hypothetical protein
MPEASRARIWTADGIVHVDVRGLEPPQPMVEILRLIDSGDASGRLIVHHHREPVFLYPELAERGWTHARVPGEPGEIRLLLTAEHG